MENGHLFGLFIEDDERPMFRGYCGDLDEARRRGQQLADIEGLPCVVVAIEGYTEVGRFSPFSPSTAPRRLVM